MVGLAIGPESAASSPAGVVNPTSRPSSGPAGSQDPLGVPSATSKGFAPGGQSRPARLLYRIASIFRAAYLREPTAGAVYGYASWGSPVSLARPGRCSSGDRPPRLYFWGLRQEPVPSRGSLAQWPSLGWIPSTPSLGAALTAAQPCLLSASCSQGSFPFF